MCAAGFLSEDGFGERPNRQQECGAIVLPDGVPAEALVAGEAKATAKGKAKPAKDGASAA